MNDMKKDFERSSRTFDSIAEHFDKTRNRAWDEVVEFLSNCEGNLLDMGCGNGRHAIEGLKRGCRVVGIDASMELLKICKKNVRNKVTRDFHVDLLRADVKKLPFQKNTFHNVIYIAAIHHLKSGRVESLEETKRVLKPGGRVLVSSWARELDRWNLDEGEKDVFVPWHREDGKVVKRFYHLYTLDELENDVKSANLDIVEKFRSKGNNYVEAEKR